MRPRTLLLFALTLAAGCVDGSTGPPTGDIAVSIAPSAAVVDPGKTNDFEAEIQNVPSGQSTAVIWSVSGNGCAGDACGTLLELGARAVRYTAPAAAPDPPTVTLKATSVADPEGSATATITIGGPGIL
jgi:hypothetical protein